MLAMTDLESDKATGLDDSSPP